MPFQDTSSDCAICLQPLSSDKQTLTCGHVYHRTCVISQLRHSEPDATRRLELRGLLCAKCGAPCEGASLETPHVTTLLPRIDALLREHGETHLHEARTRHAIYLCSVCEAPFLGGAISCDAYTPSQLPPQERLCPACATPTSCPPHHAPYHVHKCRLCCSPATHRCFARTHVCATHHAALSAPTPPHPVPCPGPPRCNTPGPARRHHNADDVSGEHLLYCALCITGSPEPPPEKCSANLLQNPAAQHPSTTAWTHFTHAMWNTQPSHHPFSNLPNNFVAGYQLTVMAQAVDLSNFLKTPQSDLPISVSARYRAHPQSESVFVLEASVLDPAFNELFHVTTDHLTPSPDSWQLARHTFRLRHGKYVVISLTSQDASSWSHLHGAKVTDCNVSVILGDSAESHILNMVQPAVDDNCAKAVEAFREERVRQHIELAQRRREDALRELDEAERQLLQQSPHHHHDDDDGADAEDELEDEWFDGDAIEDRINPEWDEEFRRQFGMG